MSHPYHANDHGSVTTGRRRTLTVSQGLDITNRVRALLKAARRAHPGRGWVISDSTYAEAFGCMQALQAMGYGYFGSSIENASDPRNLSAWFERIKSEVEA